MKSYFTSSNTSQRFIFLTTVCILICFVQVALIFQLLSNSSHLDKSLSTPPSFFLHRTKINCKQKLKCPNNITRFSVHIDKNIQFPNISYIRSPIFAIILDTIRNSSYYTNDSSLACVHIAPVDTIDRDRRSKNGYYTYFIQQRFKFFHEWSDTNKIHLIFNHYTGISFFHFQDRRLRNLFLSKKISLLRSLLGTWPSYHRTLDFALPFHHILASTSFTSTDYNCSSHVTFPLFHSDYPSNLTDSFSSSRSILLSFKGKSYEDVQHHQREKL